MYGTRVTEPYFLKIDGNKRILVNPVDEARMRAFERIAGTASDVGCTVYSEMIRDGEGRELSVAYGLKNDSRGTSMGVELVRGGRGYLVRSVTMSEGIVFEADVDGELRQILEGAPSVPKGSARRLSRRIIDIYVETDT
ncbi:hypothetical protein COV18_00820 [Candidatus Woesearchaeota archaeon CG10_big_fil_rev_8_21_14_0_10_37_12]|nr:MAG: hypothetical protein COV18_00820 [Candidatus Woesearchaeota archaeon CG10_big_fil_rev_8_21_14_0_10_37_12]